MKKFGNYIVILYSSGSRRVAAADMKWGFEEEVNFLMIDFLLLIHHQCVVRNIKKSHQKHKWEICSVYYNNHGGGAWIMIEVKIFCNGK